MHIARVNEERFISEVLKAVGVSEKDAAQTATLMTEADLSGADGHGIFRLPQYVRRLRAGGINVSPDIRIIRSADACALIDGDNGLGHCVVAYAAEHAAKLAKKSGVSWVGIRNSNHAGAGMLYAGLLARKGLVGIYCAIGNANHVAAPGSAERLLSTNPIAFGIPTTGDYPFIFDMATSIVSFGTIKRFAKSNMPLPNDWLVDVEGNPVTDPAKYQTGLLRPMGGYKGFGLGIMITVLAGILNGAAFGRAVVDFNHDDTTVTNTGQLLIALDISRMCDIYLFRTSVVALLDDIRSSKRLPGVSKIRVPGDRSHALYSERLCAGIPISSVLQGELITLARQIRVEEPQFDA